MFQGHYTFELSWHSSSLKQLHCQLKHKYKTATRLGSMGALPGAEIPPSLKNRKLDRWTDRQIHIYSMTSYLFEEDAPYK